MFFVSFGFSTVVVFGGHCDAGTIIYFVCSKAKGALSMCYVKEPTAVSLATLTASVTYIIVCGCRLDYGLRLVV